MLYPPRRASCLAFFFPICVFRSDFCVFVGHYDAALPIWDGTIWVGFHSLVAEKGSHCCSSYFSGGFFFFPPRAVLRFDSTTRNGSTLMGQVVILTGLVLLLRDHDYSCIERQTVLLSSDIVSIPRRFIFRT